MHSSRRAVFCLAALPLLIAAAFPAAAQHARDPATFRLGEICFPTSGAAAAQPYFLRGVLLMHSFDYELAAEQFRQAQRADPSFAMAYWGEAMTYTHPVWIQQDLRAARGALTRLAPTAAERRAKAPTPREKAYLDAVAVLYGEGNKDTRDTLYSGAMQRLAADFPDDDEAKAFFALSLLGLQQNGRDVPTYMRAAATMEELLGRNPKHPGAAHILIHAYDDPTHAPLGLRAARTYGDIAPDASHALHMTSHIFVSLGMWDDVIAANTKAWKLVGRGGHYSQWLSYGFLQQGRFADARKLVDEIVTQTRPAPTPYNLGYQAVMLAAYVVDAEDWDGPVARFLRDSVKPREVPGASFSSQTDALDFVSAWSALKLGRPVMAREAERRISQRVETERARAKGKYVGGLGASDVMATMLRAALAEHDGQLNAAIIAAREAATKDESYPFEFGPPETIKPPREFLGELLLKAKQPGAARGAFEQALRKTPNRARSVLGLARSNALLGDRELAARWYRHFAATWRDSDRGRVELAEALAFGGK